MGGMNVFDDDKINQLIDVSCKLNEQVNNIGYLAPHEKGSPQDKNLVKLLNEAKSFIYIPKINKMCEELKTFYNIN